MPNSFRKINHEKLCLAGINISKEKVDFLNYMNSMIFSNSSKKDDILEPECYISNRARASLLQKGKTRKNCVKL